MLAALIAATALVAALETAFRLDNASAVYLLAVVAIAILLGTAPAIATAIGAFLAYNFAFVEPRYTFTVGRADEVLTLFLLLFVGIVSGRLAGRQRDREQKASRREREARAIFGISRELATSERLTDAMQSVVARLADETGMERTWVGLGATVMHERVVADSGGVATPRPAVAPTPSCSETARRVRRPGRGSARRLRRGTRHAEPQGTTRRTALFRVELRSAEETVGSLWSQRADSAGHPQLEETRLLAAAADQLGQAVRRERLQAQTAELEIARRSDELKSALVDSVSHDLRTPLATIRATAGSLADPAIELSDADRRAAAAAIDAEAHRLNRLVGDLLDMSRIQGGALVADIEVIPLDELVRPAVERARAGAGDRPIDLELPPDLPSVRADAALLDQVISNLLENAVRYAGPDAAIRVHGSFQPRRHGVARGRGRRSRGARRGPAEALRPLLPRRTGDRRTEARVRAGPLGREGAGGGDGRQRHGREELHGRARGHRHPPRRARRPGRRMKSEASAQLLLVEDDEATRHAIAANLTGHGYRVREAPDGEEALRRWEEARPDLILLDLGLPGIDGLAVVRHVRRDATTPIIVLSARDQERDKVAALDAGADDYLTKPFGMAELHARLRASLRRSLGAAAEADGRVEIGPLELDPLRRRVTVGGNEVHLTPREYELLKALLGNAGRVVSRGRLLRAVWGVEYANESHYLHVHVAGIRRKLAASDPDGALAGLIVAEPGVGYRVRDAEELRPAP